MTTVQFPLVGPIYTIDFDQIEAIGVISYRGIVIVAGNRNIYNPVTRILIKRAFIAKIEAESGVILSTKEFENWEMVTLQQGMAE